MCLKKSFTFLIMKPKKIFITLFSLSFYATSFSQPTDLHKIDNELLSLYKAMVSADPQNRYDSLAPAFKRQLLLYLEKPVTFNNNFDSLSKYLAIRTSSDGKIKFYSWDDLSGGTWHNFNCLAQFITKNGKVVIKQINTENETGTGEFTDSGVYDIFALFNDSVTYYLTMAYGTHGSGQQHQIVQLFYISGDKLEKCKRCFADSNDLVIQYPRSEKANLVFDSGKKQLSYNEFILDEETGFYRPSGKRIILVFINGTFK